MIDLERAPISETAAHALIAECAKDMLPHLARSGEIKRSPPQANQCPISRIRLALMSSDDLRIFPSPAAHGITTTKNPFFRCKSFAPSVAGGTGA
jgi:hypothetical protein